MGIEESFQRMSSGEDAIRSHVLSFETGQALRGS